MKSHNISVAFSWYYTLKGIDNKCLGGTIYDT